MTEFLLIFQAILLILLLIAIGVMLGKLQATSARLESLMSEVEKTLANDIRPTLAEAREAIKQIDVAASGAAKTLQAAEPLVSAASQVASVFKKPATSIWMDALNLGIRVFSIVSGGGAEKSPSKPTSDSVPLPTATTSKEN
ncbi:MAG: hypothetical protein U0R49_05540 [Fimbriimonadales bacterium]